MNNHPEQQPNEKYLGNSSCITVPSYLSHISSIRYGVTAYDLDGKRLTDAEQSYLWPMFVAKKELHLYDKAMMQRKFPAQKYYLPQGF